MLALWPLAAGGALWLFVRWRDQRDLVERAEATPDTTATGVSAPAAPGSIRGILDDYSAAPVTQFPGTFDEFSGETVNVGGDLPVRREVRPPRSLYPEKLVDGEPLQLRDEVTARPIASLGDDADKVYIQPYPSWEPIEPRSPRLQPDHAEPVSSGGQE